VSIFQKSNKKQSSRRQINIKGVRDNVLMLPYEQYRVILQASSINFELRSEEEQDAIIETYQNFLNSLACPVQIIVRTRELDMQKYLDSFEAVSANEEQEIYRNQIRNYAEFVQGLVSTNKILTRSFYVVVPYANVDKADFDSIKERLALSCDIIAKGLGRLGVQTRQLNSIEVLDLFYSFYSPKVAKRQPLTDQTLELLRKSYI
jgi:hypothetical protein